MSPIARVNILRSYPDDDEVQVTVDVDDSYPQSLDEALVIAMRGFREACGVAQTEAD